MKILQNKYVDQHEEISDIEFEIINLSTNEDTEALSEKIDELADKHNQHIGFEEQHLFPLLEEHVPEKILEHIKGEHVEIIKKIKELKDEAKQEHNKQKILETASHLRGIHTSHIRAESKFFYPLLDDINEEKTKEILKKYEKQHHKNYTPIKARENKK